MWTEVRASAKDLIERIVNELSVTWPNLMSSIHVEAMPEAPVLVDCEIFRSGLGNSIGI